MISELIRAFFFIFIAEMGDKTQILAMAFATQYKVSKVLLGVLIGSALNHGLAIILGAYLSNIVPMESIQIIAGASFILFGIWGLKSDSEEEEKNNNKYGPILTVAIAFFIGELGDKTQLTAMALSTDADFPVFILLGTVLGMIATSGLGIFVGSKIGEKIPELAIKLVSSAIFIFFGTIKLFQTVPTQYINSTTVITYFVLLFIIIFILLRPILIRRKDNRKTALQEVAATLYIQANELKKAVDDICLGESNCGKCEGKSCPIGFTKEALGEATTKGEYVLPSGWGETPSNIYKDFEKSKIMEALSMTIAHFMRYGVEENRDYVINRTREALETILFGQVFPIDKELNGYFKALKRKNEKISKRVIRRAKEIYTQKQDKQS